MSHKVFYLTLAVQFVLTLGIVVYFNNNLRAVEKDRDEWKKDTIQAYHDYGVLSENSHAVQQNNIKTLAGNALLEIDLKKCQEAYQEERIKLLQK